MMIVTVTLAAPGAGSARTAPHTSFHTNMTAPSFARLLNKKRGKLSSKEGKYVVLSCGCRRAKMWDLPPEPALLSPPGRPAVSHHPTYTVAVNKCVYKVLLSVEKTLHSYLYWLLVAQQLYRPIRLFIYFFSFMCCQHTNSQIKLIKIK